MARVHRRETRFLRVWGQVTRHLPRNRVEQSPESAQLNLGFEFVVSVVLCRHIALEPSLYG